MYVETHKGKNSLSNAKFKFKKMLWICITIAGLKVQSLSNKNTVLTPKIEKSAE